MLPVFMLISSWSLLC